MTEQAQMLLLKGRLKKIRRDKRNIMILGWVIFSAVVVIVWGLQNWKVSTATLVYVLIGEVVIGVIGRLTVIKHYNAEEAQVIWQIKQLVK